MHNRSSLNNQGQGQQSASGGGGLPDEEVVIDEEKGIYMCRINETEHVVSMGSDFPNPAHIVRGKLNWVPAPVADPNHSLMVLDVDDDWSDGGEVVRKRTFACFGSKAPGFLLMQPRGQTYFERHTVDVHVSAIRSLIVDSELNCLVHSMTTGEPLEGADIAPTCDLFNPKGVRCKIHERDQQSYVDIQSFGSKQTLSETTFIIDSSFMSCTEDSNTEICAITRVNVRINSRLEQRTALVFAVPQSNPQQRIFIELPTFAYNGEFVFSAIQGMVTKGLEVLPTAQEEVAIKTIPVYNLRGGRNDKLNCQEDRMKEVAAMQFVRMGVSSLIQEAQESSDPHLDDYLEGSRCLIDFKCAVSDGRRLHILTAFSGIDICEPFLNNALANPIKSNGRADLSKADRWFKIWKKMAKGIFILHKIGFAHLDQSVENALVSQDGNDDVVIIDYGQAVYTQLDPVAGDGVTTCRMPRNKDTLSFGKDYYRPIEVFEDALHLVSDTLDAKAFDMWQLGIMLGILIGGTRPYVSEKDARAPTKEGKRAIYTEQRREFLQMIYNGKYDDALDTLGVNQYLRTERPHIVHLFENLVMCERRNAPEYRRFTIDQVIAFLNDVEMVSESGGSGAGSGGGGP